MTRFRAFALAGALALLGGAALAADAAAPAAPAAEATAAAAKPAASMGTPAPGKAQVIFFRPSKFLGAAIFSRVRENDAIIGTLANGRYFVVDLDPGIHTFQSSTGAKDAMRLEIDAGEVYYVAASLSTGIAMANFSLTPSTKDAFDTAAKNMRQAN